MTSVTLTILCNKCGKTYKLITDDCKKIDQCVHCGFVHEDIVILGKEYAMTTVDNEGVPEHLRLYTNDRKHWCMGTSEKSARKWDKKIEARIAEKKRKERLKKEYIKEQEDW